MRQIALIISLTRPLNALHPLLMLFAAYIVGQGGNQGGILSGALLYFLAHSVITIWNDIEDVKTDVLNGRKVVNSLIKNRQQNVLKLAIGVFGVATIALFLCAEISTISLILLLFTLGWMYNAKPVQACKRPLLSIILLWMCYGVIPFSIGAALSEISWALILLGLGWSFARVSISLLKDFKDAKGDAQTNKRTFLLVYGKTRVAQASIALCISGLSLLLIGLTSFIDIKYLLLLVPLILWLIYHRTQLFKVNNYHALNLLFQQALGAQLLFDLMVVTCVII